MGNVSQPTAGLKNEVARVTAKNSLQTELGERSATMSAGAVAAGGWADEVKVILRRVFVGGRAPAQALSDRRIFLEMTPIGKATVLH